MPARDPKQERSAASTERMLDAATAILAQSGLDGLTVERVVELSETSMGTFYLRFESRQGLIDALHRRFLQTVPPQMAQAIDTKEPKQDLRAELEDLYFTFFTGAEVHKDSLAFFMLQAPKTGDIHEDVRKVQAMLYEIFTRRVKFHKGELESKGLASKIDFTFRLGMGLFFQVITGESGLVTSKDESNKKLAAELAEVVATSLSK
jgi:AcrR family transcriptional regulator